MSQRILKMTALESNSITFADPMNVSNTLRMKHSLTPKRASDTSNLTNVRNEFITSRIGELAPIVAGARVPTETLSVRVVISGSTQSEAQVLQAVKDTFANAQLAITAGALRGFLADHTTQFVIDSE